jgi:hypothetical protein
MSSCFSTSFKTLSCHGLHAYARALLFTFITHHPTITSRHVTLTWVSAQGHPWMNTAALICCHIRSIHSQPSFSQLPAPSRYQHCKLEPPINQETSKQFVKRELLSYIPEVNISRLYNLFLQLGTLIILALVILTSSHLDQANVPRQSTDESDSSPFCSTNAGSRSLSNPFRYPFVLGGYLVNYVSVVAVPPIPENRYQKTGLVPRQCINEDDSSLFCSTNAGSRSLLNPFKYPVVLARYVAKSVSAFTIPPLSENRNQQTDLVLRQCEDEGDSSPFCSTNAGSRSLSNPLRYPVIFAKLFLHSARAFVDNPAGVSSKGMYCTRAAHTRPDTVNLDMATPAHTRRLRLRWRRVAAKIPSLRARTPVKVLGWQARCSTCTI